VWLIQILCVQVRASKRLAGEGQKPGRDDLQGSAHRLLGVIVYYNRTNTESYEPWSERRMSREGNFV
jgi:hypothetical protein